MSKPTTFIFIIVCIMVVLSVVQVVISTSLSTAGIELAKLQDRQSYYSKQNALLQEKLLFISSYSYISSRAKELGFVGERIHMYLSPLPLAVKP